MLSLLPHRRMAPSKKPDPRAAAARRNGRLGGRPRAADSERTVLIRAYAADVPNLKAHGRTQAAAIRNLLAKLP